LHIIVIAIGTSGDVYPLLGLSRTLVGHGHKVSFCTSPAFAEEVERCGLRLIPAGSVEDYRAAVNDPEMWNPRRSMKTLWKAVAARIRPMYDLLYKEIDSDTVIAAHPWAFSARLLNEKYGVPLVTTQISPSTFFSARKPPVHKQFTVPSWLPYPARAALMWGFDRLVLDRICGPDINALRAELGLPPIKHIIGHWIHSPQGVVALFPEWFAPPQSDWPANVTLAGFPLYDGGAFREMDAELEDFLAAGRPPIVFTPGSTMVNGEAYFAAAAAALEKLNERGVFLAGPSTTMPTSMKNIMVRSYVPLSALLKRSRALVHHGGIGTCAQAFAAGLPQLVTPFAHDQFDNAARIKAVGCGLIATDYTDPAALFNDLKSLLEDSQLHDHCRIIQAGVLPPEAVCLKALKVIEAVARNRTAQPQHVLSTESGLVDA
jgi:rhamnosyltransferase subunit B